MKDDIIRQSSRRDRRCSAGARTSPSRSTRCGILDSGAHTAADDWPELPGPAPVGFLQHSAILFLRPQCGTIYSFGCLRTATSGGIFMKSSVIKRSIVLAGHKTSVSLEDAFWRALKEIAGGRHITLSDLVSSIDSERQQGNLSSAVRLFVLDF